MRACGVRAPRRAGWSRSLPYGSPLHQRDSALPRCTATALRRASRGFQQVGFLRLCASNIATARALSLRRRRSTCACGVCAPRCAGWSRSLPYGSPLRQRDGALPRCTAALRRACRGIQQAAFLRMCARNNAISRVLSLGRRRNTRACGVCAPRWLESVPALWKPSAPARRLSPSVHGHAPTCQPRPPTSSSRHSRVRTRERATARSLLEEA